MIIYPADKAEHRGVKFLDYVVAKRRFFFDNYFHRILHKATFGDVLAPPPPTRSAGISRSSRDTMLDVNSNDTPTKDEIDRPVTGFNNSPDNMNFADGERFVR